MNPGGGEWRLARALIVCLVLLAEAGLFVLDARVGAFLPFTAFYIALLYFALTRAGSTWAYLLALVAAAGRTWAIGQALPQDLPEEFILRQFAGSFSVLGLTCYLLDRRGQVPRPATHAAWIGWRHQRHLAPLTLAGLGFFAAFAPKVSGAVTPPSYQVDRNGVHIVGNPGIASAQGGIWPRTKVLLLTIDDGPADAAADTAILDVLERHRVRSIWFVTCRDFDPLLDPQAAANARTLQRLAHSGQVLANHGYHHLSMVDLEQDPQNVRREISRCSAAIDAATGIRPRYFRAPFGEFTAQAIEAAADNGLHIMRWNMSYDSIYGFHRNRGNEATAASPEAMQHFVGSLESGDIVLLHDDRRTAASIEQFLASAEQHGFSFGVPDDGSAVKAPRAGDPRSE